MKKRLATMPPIDWARRVNHSWLVRGGLDGHAEAWLRHLAQAHDGRLLASCIAARAMCSIRTLLEDPKPWFYAGLFHLATADEARALLTSHPLTMAALPAMHGDGQVCRWLEESSPELRELVARLRAGLARLHEDGPVV